MSLSIDRIDSSIRVEPNTTSVYWTIGHSLACIGVTECHHLLNQTQSIAFIICPSSVVLFDLHFDIRDFSMNELSESVK